MHLKWDKLILILLLLIMKINDLHVKVVFLPFTGGMCEKCSL